MSCAVLSSSSTRHRLATTCFAPTGTKGELTVRDLTSGATLQQPGSWRAGAGGWPGFWERLERQFT
jgi:hypothetical protein